ncbi:PKD domain-containing protein [Candidatus Peregrinibacteria bacterium]|nr:PKD domain-containing protein [Candidatus Peregrinibacteria bacterium]
MDDDNLKKPTDMPEEPTAPEEVSGESRSLSPEAENVAVNQPDLEKAKEELNASLAKAKEEAALKPSAPEPPAEDPGEEVPAGEKPAEPPVKPMAEEKKSVPSKTAMSVPPKKIGKESSKRKSNAKFLMVMGLTLASLFVLFVVLMVLVIAGGGAESPVLSSLGVDAAGIKSFLLTIINLSFGFLALVFFVIGVIGVFKLLFAKKGDKEARSHGIRMTLAGLLPLAVIMVVWMLLYNFISTIEITAERVKAEIVILEPAELTGLKAPLEVTFSSENAVKALQAGDLQISGIRWDFDGDGTFETEPRDFEVSYLYSRQGNYNVGLQVSVAGEEEPRVYNYLLAIEEALFGAEPSKGTAPLKVKFDASGLIPKGTKVQSLDWDFDGDGTYELTGKDNLRPEHTFEQIGTYNVHLRMIDQDNLVDNYYREIEIIPGDRPLLSAEITATPGLSGVIPLQIRFDGGKSESVKGTIVNYEWDFGDGSQVQVGRSVSHIYNEAGTYTVTLMVREDSGKEAETSEEVTVRTVSSVPEARISTNPPADAGGNLSGELPFKIAFDASASTDADGDIVEYEWDFGLDAATQAGQKVEFTYETAGMYTATLVVRDSEGQESSSNVKVEVTEPGVRAVVTAMPEEGTAPLTVDFDGSSSSAFEGKIVSYEWDFGDGSAPTITSARVSHKYNDVGTYAVRLKVTTNQNETAQVIKNIYVREIPLRACFTPSRRNGEAPLAVTFDAKCSTGAASVFRWDFGDGEDSDARKPSHTFENPGTYNVTLEVSDDKNNVSDFSDVIVVEGTLE